MYFADSKPLILKTLLLDNLPSCQICRGELSAPQRARIQPQHAILMPQPQRRPMPKHNRVAGVLAIGCVKPCVLFGRNVGIRCFVGVIEAAVCIQRSHSRHHVGDVAQAVLSV